MSPASGLHRPLAGSTAPGAGWWGERREARLGQLTLVIPGAGSLARELFSQASLANLSFPGHRMYLASVGSHRVHISWTVVSVLPSVCVPPTGQRPPSHPSSSAFAYLRMHLLAAHGNSSCLLNPLLTLAACVCANLCSSSQPSWGTRQPGHGDRGVCWGARLVSGREPGVVSVSLTARR